MFRYMLDNVHSGHGSLCPEKVTLAPSLDNPQQTKLKLTSLEPSLAYLLPDVSHHLLPVAISVSSDHLSEEKQLSFSRLSIP